MTDETFKISKLSPAYTDTNDGRIGTKNGFTTLHMRQERDNWNMGGRL